MSVAIPSASLRNKGCVAVLATVAGADTVWPSDDKENNGDDDSSKEADKTATKDGWTEHQEPLLVQLLAKELGVEASDIHLMMIINSKNSSSFMAIYPH